MCVACAQPLYEMLAACLDHAALQVALAALTCVANLIQAMEEQSDRDRFQPMINPMLNCLGRALQAKDEESAQGALEVLIEVREGRRNCAQIMFLTRFIYK